MRVAAGAMAVMLPFGPAPVAAQTGPVFARTVDRTVEEVIVSGHTAFAGATERLVVSVSELCAGPDQEALAKAHARFATGLEAFSRVELFRFGPAREDNRFERLFFWPDRRGRGRRQVEALIAQPGEATPEVASLRAKSVAVQGLLALEYILFGRGSAGLADGTAVHRCRLGETVARAVDHTARDILRGWTGPGGFGAVMRSPGPDNPVYRSHGETVEDLLGAAGEQLRIVERQKLLRMLREGPRAARPKAAPFWRSGLALAAIAANLDGVLALQTTGRLETLLPAPEAGIAEQIVSELRQARAILAAASGESLPGVLVDPESHRGLVDAAAGIGRAASLYREHFPRALGLAAGFNSLDGD